MPEGLNLGDVYTSVGSAVGTPAAIALFWVIGKVRELGLKVKKLEDENALFKQTLSDIRSDVSYIRGKLEQDGACSR